MTTIKMKTEHIDNTLTIDRRSFIQGVAIAAVGIAAVNLTNSSLISDSQALSANTQGKVIVKIVRKPHMARFKKMKSRAAQVV